VSEIYSEYYKRILDKECKDIEYIYAAGKSSLKEGCQYREESGRSVFVGDESAGFAS
jgi:hypothetical protein